MDKVQEVNCTTGEITEREFTPEEIQEAEEANTASEQFWAEAAEYADVVAAEDEAVLAALEEATGFSAGRLRRVLLKS